MKLAFTSRTVTLIGLLALASLSGCMAFADSSAMRIEVEVYKGPLSMEPELQLGELFGYLREAYNGLTKTQAIVSSVQAHYEFDSNLTDPCTKYKPAEPDTEAGAVGIFDKTDCSLLLMLQDDIARLQTSLLLPICQLTQSTTTNPCEFSNPSDKSLHPTVLTAVNAQLQNLQLSPTFLASSSPSTSSSKSTNADLRNALIEANRAAAAMQAAAFRYATAATGGRSFKYRVRKAQTHFIVATSEYANQIQARADVLLKQLGTHGRDRRELPLSAHLRESEPTDFLHLYDWMSAKTPSHYPLFALSPVQMSIEDRIKVVRRLYSDHFWSKINTVYASGRGKTQMAFIKDETGNWNLKSFDNDPTELLDAYTKAAKAALEGVVKVTQDLATGGGSAGGRALANQLLAIADQAAPDKPQPVAAPAGTLSLTHLQNRLLRQLDEDALKKDLKQDADNLTAFNSETDPDVRKGKQQTLSMHRAKVIKKWTDHLEDHSNLVDILSSTVKNK